jgi:hypothetical protein
MFPFTLLAACGGEPEAAPEAPAPARYVVEPARGADGLRGPEELEGAALFEEIATVFGHARCTNCHTGTAAPRQDDDGHLHVPAVARGVPGLQCGGCHMRGNVEHAGVPGAVGWDAPPDALGWRERTPAAICARLAVGTPEAREHLVEYVATSPTVAWAFEPGPGRTPAPGNRPLLASLVRAWVDGGAPCPE